MVVSDGPKPRPWTNRSIRRYLAILLLLVTMRGRFRVCLSKAVRAGLGALLSWNRVGQVLQLAALTLFMALAVGVPGSHPGPQPSEQLEQFHIVPVRIEPTIAASGGTTDSRPISGPLSEPLFFDRRNLVGCSSRKVRRTKAEIEQERRALLEKTIREIDAIVAEFHAKLPRERAQAIGSAYARYSSRYQSSIADQVRAIFEAAFARGIFIPREYMFFDMGVRGFKERRTGLTALRAMLNAKGCDVFLVFATSRLFRRAYKAQQFAEEDLVENGIRGIFLHPLIDMADSNWRLTFQVLCSLDEQQVRSIGSFVRAAHEGLFIRGMVCTSLPLGFTGEEVPGELTKRKLPRRKIIIDSETSPWIGKIFEWYVNGDEKLGVGPMSIDQIAQRLNDDPEAPAPAKSLTGLWTHDLVREHLMNAAYRGFWCYGAKESTWSGKKDYAKQSPRLKPLKSDQFENLRIVSDELWYAAQGLLAKEIAASGRKPKDGDYTLRPRILRRLFVCPEHERRLVVGGPGGQIMYCQLCRAIVPEKRPLFSYLNRARAVQQLCEVLADLVRGDEELVADIIAECQRAVESGQKPDPTETARLRAQAERLGRNIDFNRRNPGDTEEEQGRTQNLIKQLQNERNAILANLAASEAAANRQIVVPTPEQVRTMLDELAQKLASAGIAGTTEEVRAVRRIIDELTGGQIELYQMGERRKGRGWLQARFQVDVVSVALGRLAGVTSTGQRQGVDVVIDFRAPRQIDQQADEAKLLWDQGLLGKEIARKKGWARCYVTKLIHHWFHSRGLPVPDGRSRRHQIEQERGKMPTYKWIADEAVRLADEGLHDLAIGRKFDTSGATVAKAIKWWYTTRGLSAPTGAERRRAILERARQMYQDDVLITDIAAELGYSPQGLTLALKEYLKEFGEPMPDGRSRRVNAKSGQRASGHAAAADNGSPAKEADGPHGVGPEPGPERS